ncbi:hypothetical protein R3P38DRAFT_3223317 [Favolaschia claudopus]|uniref:Uncharacterized protein n=1 Tax=Favolaschia claudopus TaxID=2862362 RepID=A0AAV9ZXR7_9AGAR
MSRHSPTKSAQRPPYGTYSSSTYSICLPACLPTMVYVIPLRFFLAPYSPVPSLYFHLPPYSVVISCSPATPIDALFARYISVPYSPSPLLSPSLGITFFARPPPRVLIAPTYLAVPLITDS